MSLPETDTVKMKALLHQHAEMDADGLSPVQEQHALQ